MTEVEELAEEYVQTLLEKDDEEIDNLFEENLGDLKLTAKQAGTLLGIIKGIGIAAFLAGYKAGIPKWHKVADEDLPIDGKEVFIKFVNGKYAMAFSLGVLWYELDGEEITDEIYAWCELPKCEEE